jgi:hypothetical protein
MIEAQADAEDDQNAHYLCAGVETMNPGASVQVKEYIHIELIIVKLALQN